VIARGAPLPLLGPDPAAPARLHLVGRYALGVDWQDGHQRIYAFDVLRAACDCAGCAAAPAGEVSGSWPAAIARAAPGVRIRWADGHETALAGAALRQRCPCAGCTTGAPR
jgi:DUF971 family protein